jgi:hypothetical protein
MRTIVCALLFTTTLLWARPASADLITIEPDAFAAGTDLTAATAGVLLWTARVTGSPGDPLSLTPVYAQHSSACDNPGTGPGPCYAATGTQGFSPFSAPEGTLLSWSSDRHPANCFAQLNNPDFSGPSCESFVGFTALLIELTVPTTFVEIAGGWNSDFLELRALTEDFNLLSLPQTLTQDPRLPGYATTGTVAMSAPEATMKYVFAGSTEGGIALDRLRFEQVPQVPEPSTLLLTIAGLVGLGWHRRRRTRSM